MLTTALSFCSFNVRGIKEQVKRKAVFLFCKNYKADFYFLQETHALTSDFNFWKNQWGDDIWMSYGSNNSAGVAILKGSFQGKIHRSLSHCSGRWILLVVEFMNEIFILGNIYGYNCSARNKSLFEEFEQQVNTLTNTFLNAKLVFGGDWNSINDPLKDCYPPRPVNCPHGEVKNLCLHLNCYDVWRSKYPLQTQFTWNNKDLSRNSRIDFWLISNELDSNVNETRIDPSILSDHKVIFLSLLMGNSPLKKNLTLWKLNNTLLKDELFKEQVKEVISENWRKAQEEKCFGKHWEFAKYQIRNIAIMRGKALAKEKRFQQNRILKDIITIYERDSPSQVDINQLLCLQLELDKIYENMAQGAFIRSRRKWLEKGEKNTKYFHNLEKRNAKINSIFKLNINQHISEDPKKISDFVEDFYRKLYTEPDSGHNTHPLTVNQIDQKQKDHCDQKISIEELKKILRG